MDNQPQNTSDTLNKEIDDLLLDPAKKAAILQRLGRPDASHLALSGSNGGVNPSFPSGSTPSPSGMFPAPHGAYSHPAAWYPLPPFPVMSPQLFPWAPPVPPVSVNDTNDTVPANNNGGATPPAADTNGGVTSATASRTPVNTAAGDDDEPDSNPEEQEDRISLLDDSEANEFEDFDARVREGSSWIPPAPMLRFLEKNFNPEESLKDSDREKILADFPMPECDAIRVPRLDPEVKDQLRKRGQNPQFGTERALFRIQEQMLEVTGPLTCLWADLQYTQDKPTCEQMVHLIQRALVLLGNTSHSINIERRRIAWNRINPTLKSLAVENYSNREQNLFGPGFLEKASKKLDADRAMAKVVSNPPNNRKRPYEEDPTDLRSFLGKGAPAHGGRGKQRQYKPYNQQGNFRKNAKTNCQKPHTSQYKPQTNRQKPQPNYQTRQ